MIEKENNKEQLKKDDDSVVKIKEATERGGKYTVAYAMGWKEIDEALKGGVREGDLIVISGISGHGKTMLALNIAVNLSERGYPSLFFSYEMGIDNVFAKFKEVAEKESDLLVYTPQRNTSGNTEWIKRKIREGKEKYNTRFVFIDHLDFLAPKERMGTADNYRIAVKNICQELKDIAIEEEITIFLLCQVRKVPIGRNVEMQDVAESRSVYQLADTILVVARNIIVQKIGGVKTETFGENSTLRLIKNRITGQQETMEFRLAPGTARIKPLGVKSDIEKNLSGEKEEREDEIIVDDLF